MLRHATRAVLTEAVGTAILFPTAYLPVHVVDVRQPRGDDRPRVHRLFLRYCGADVPWFIAGQSGGAMLGLGFVRSLKEDS